MRFSFCRFQKVVQLDGLLLLSGFGKVDEVLSATSGICFRPIVIGFGVGPRERAGIEGKSEFI